MERKSLALLILLTSSLYWFLSAPLLVCVSFDVERDPPAINRGQVGFKGVEAIPGLLEVLDSHGVEATFFVTGRVAQLYPGTLRAITERGHEVAVHGGYYHDEPLWEPPVQGQATLINATTASIEAVTGIKPKGYRAPGHRITPATMAALESLGFVYDSSVVPSLAGSFLYGHPFYSPEGPYYPDHQDIFSPGEMTVLEIPITPVFLNGNLDSLLAYQGEALTGFELFAKAVECRMKRRPLVIYLHPGHMVDLPNEPSNYRTGNHILHGLDRMLVLLDIMGAEYAPLEEVAGGKKF